MRSLLTVLLLCLSLPAAAQDRAPRPRGRITELPEQHVYGRRASFVFVPRARDRYDVPPLVRRDLPREVVRTVRRDCFD